MKLKAWSFGNKRIELHSHAHNLNLMFYDGVRFIHTIEISQADAEDFFREGAKLAAMPVMAFSTEVKNYDHPTL